MVAEVIGALAIGALVFWLLFQPMLFPSTTPAWPPEPIADEETRSGMALLALKEIEFDRATGKLSEADYLELKERYGKEALRALDDDQRQSGQEATSADPEALVAARLTELRSAHAAGAVAPATCPSCGPRPEPDAAFCSSCGRTIGEAAFCSSCGGPLAPDSRFCAACGTRVAA